MKNFITAIAVILLSGCMVTTKSIHNAEPTFIKSDSNARIGVLMPKDGKFIYCPDAPADTAKAIDSNVQAALKATAVEEGSASVNYKTAIVNLANRNTTTNVLVYSVNSLCFLSMNKALNNEQIEGLFKQVLDVVTIISTADLKNEAAQKATAEKAKADAERAKAEADKAKADAEAKKNKAEAEKNKEAANKATKQLQLQQFNLKHNLPQNFSVE